MQIIIQLHYDSFIEEKETFQLAKYYWSHSNN